MKTKNLLAVMALGACASSTSAQEGGFSYRLVEALVSTNSAAEFSASNQPFLGI